MDTPNICTKTYTHTSTHTHKKTAIEGRGRWWSHAVNGFMFVGYFFIRTFCQSSTVGPLHQHAARNNTLEPRQMSLIKTAKLGRNGVKIKTSDEHQTASIRTPNPLWNLSSGDLINSLEASIVPPRWSRRLVFGLEPRQFAAREHPSVVPTGDVRANKRQHAALQTRIDKQGLICCLSGGWRLPGGRESYCVRFMCATIRSHIPFQSPNVVDSKTVSDNMQDQKRPNNTE